MKMGKVERLIVENVWQLHINKSRTVSIRDVSKIQRRGTTLVIIHAGKSEKRKTGRMSLF